MRISQCLSPRRRVAALVAFILLPFVSSAFGGEATPNPGNMYPPGAAPGWNFKNLTPEQQQSALRFSTFVNKGVPEEYLKVENTVGYTTRAIFDGGPLYLANCSKCHGASGLGNGALASALTPSPAMLAYIIQQPIAIDQFLFWTISEGGKQFGTAMPAFKDQLTHDQIWQVIAYLRAGFPSVEDKKAGGATPPATTDD
jgi:mono/diheme cytochrome c family protein